MSGFGQARDVLRDAETFHRRLAEVYSDMARNHEHPRFTLLFNYLSQHEEQLGQQVANYAAKASPHVLDMWFQAVHPQCTITALDDADVSTEQTLDGVTEFALKMDSCLMETYRRVTSSSEPPEIREIFESLLAMEQSQKEQLAMNAQQICDL